VANKDTKSEDFDYINSQFKLFFPDSVKPLDRFIQFINCITNRNIYAKFNKYASKYYDNSASRYYHTAKLWFLKDLFKDDYLGFVAIYRKLFENEPTKCYKKVKNLIVKFNENIPPENQLGFRKFNSFMGHNYIRNCAINIMRFLFASKMNNKAPLNSNTHMYIIDILNRVFKDDLRIWLGEYHQTNCKNIWPDEEYEEEQEKIKDFLKYYNNFYNNKDNSINTEIEDDTVKEEMFANKYILFQIALEIINILFLSVNRKCFNTPISRFHITLDKVIKCMDGTKVDDDEDDEGEEPERVFEEPVYTLGNASPEEEFDLPPEGSGGRRTKRTKKKQRKTKKSKRKSRK
jgi:hypothetical protein